MMRRRRDDRRVPESAGQCRLRQIKNIDSKEMDRSESSYRSCALGRVYGDEKLYENGLGKAQKRALIIMTVGGPPETYSGYNINPPLLGRDRQTYTIIHLMQDNERWALNMNY